MKKTNCPHSLLYCTPNPCVCFPWFRDSQRKPGPAESEGHTFPGPVLPRRRASAARTQARGFLERSQGQERGGGRTRSWWLCVFPVIAMGIGKGDLINLPDELCITSASCPPSLKALLFELLESHHLTPPCLGSCCPTSIREAFGTWSLGPPNRVPPANWQNYWNMCNCLKTHARVCPLFSSLSVSLSHTRT